MSKSSKLRTVQWEDMTSPEFADAVKASGGVCVLTVGAMERHGAHLPLGNDSLSVHEVAVRAARREAAVVFPANYFGQTQATRNQPGSVALRNDVLLAMLDNLCDEIGRNGLKKIIVLNGHGGNEYLLPTFADMQMERPRGYQVYVVRLGGWFTPPKEDAKWEKMKQTPFDWHAGETETSMSLGLFPERVQMDKVGKPYVPNKRLGHLPNVTVPYWWPALVPGQYAGDASYATEEKGRYLVEYEVSQVASIIRAVKKDKEVAKVAAEYFAATDAHGVLYGPRKKKARLLR